MKKRLRPELRSGDEQFRGWSRVLYPRFVSVQSASLLLIGVVTEMARQATVVLYIVLLVAVVVGVDLLFFRNRFWERLMVNIGIVLVFAAFGLRFLKYP